MRIGWVLLALSACGGPMVRSLSDAAGAGMNAAGDAGVDAGVPSLAGCRVFPLGNAWNRAVSSEPVDPHSADYLAFMGAGSLNLHPDFGGPYGQPFVVVPADQARVPMSFLYAPQSEPGSYPVPADVPLPANGDLHATVPVRHERQIYE